MSAIASHRSVSERLVESAADRRAAAAGPVTAAVPPLDGATPRGLLAQVGALLAKTGAHKADVLIFVSVYAGVVLLAGLMYAGARLGNADGWRWGLKLMNVPLAAAGLGSLIAASIAAGAAVVIAGRRTRQSEAPAAAGVTFSGGIGRWGVAACLIVACLGCAGFLTTVLLDHDAKAHYGIRPGNGFQPNERYVARRFGVRLPAQAAAAAAEPVALPVAAAPAPAAVDPEKGHKLFIGTCASCHGLKGEGMPGQGKPLVHNTFIQGQDDAQLLAFLKVGRQPWDPANTTKVQMPPRGGNPALTDDHLRSIVAYLRTVQGPSAAAAPAALAEGARQPPGPGDTASRAEAAPASPPKDDDFALRLSLHRWVVSEPPHAPGLQAGFVEERARPRWAPPAGAAAFVNAYYSMTQFQMLHVGLLLVVLGFALHQAIRGRVAPDNRGLLALGAAACWWVTGLWAAAFPFVYLI
ncbi:MAG: cytochrome c [Phycisphaerae bacterium]|nr:cytochrome c [Phycisphaerae bacterium]MCZ2399083.1 cytochrome c [Phycisphaerae bacterium]